VAVSGAGWRSSKHLSGANIERMLEPIAAGLDLATEPQPIYQPTAAEAESSPCLSLEMAVETDAD
jgi:hypothetical protein